MDIKENLKGIIFKIIIVFFSSCTLLWFSIFSYGILYYLYIPAVAHTKPVYLQYDMSCLRRKHCDPVFPSDNITLTASGNEFLRGGQGYTIELVLEMPESEYNLNQGMFMIKLDMINIFGNIITSSYRPALLHYRSSLFKLFYTVICMPALLAGSLDEKQILTVPLFEKYVEDSSYPAHFAYVEVQSPFIEVYSSSLKIHAQFTGLRYLMYYWPVLSAVIGIGGHFLFLVSTMSLIWVYEVTKNPEIDGTSVELSQSLPPLSMRRKTKKQKDLSEEVEIETLATHTDRQRKKVQADLSEEVEIETLATHTDTGIHRMVEDLGDS